MNSRDNLLIKLDKIKEYNYYNNTKKNTVQDK